MYGFKLDKEEIKSHQKVKTVNGYDIDFYAYEGLKIPKIIAEDKKFKLFFSPYKDEYLEIGEVLIDRGNFYLFNFFPKENSYFILNNFTNKIKKENHSSYIIVTSSLIDLKYKVIFKDLNKIETSSDFLPKMDCKIEIESLEQISFIPEDIKYLE
ncbi:hypothetical protein CPU12_13710 [Malaciobacter molluscorum LMG 25693]|uniref:Uncharacterized protein n=3 Tax=Malaciobacter molluscorum TaxID=1032072 RepID=A0A2G1DED4_9BACT|nr:hypothetical protein CPU12_13710 [Malaciobacter molluscorum LMG 25693]